MVNAADTASTLRKIACKLDCALIFCEDATDELDALEAESVRLPRLRELLSQAHGLLQRATDEAGAGAWPLEKEAEHDA